MTIRTLAEVKAEIASKTTALQEKQRAVAALRNTANLLSQNFDVLGFKSALDEAHYSFDGMTNSIPKTIDGKIVFVKPIGYTIAEYEQVLMNLNEIFVTGSPSLEEKSRRILSSPDSMTILYYNVGEVLGRIKSCWENVIGLFMRSYGKSVYEDYFSLAPGDMFGENIYYKVFPVCDNFKELIESLGNMGEKQAKADELENNIFRLNTLAKEMESPAPPPLAPGVFCLKYKITDFLSAFSPDYSNLTPEERTEVIQQFSNNTGAVAAFISHHNFPAQECVELSIGKVSRIWIHRSGQPLGTSLTDVIPTALQEKPAPERTGQEVSKLCNASHLSIFEIGPGTSLPMEPGIPVPGLQKPPPEVGWAEEEPESSNRAEARSGTGASGTNGGGFNVFYLLVGGLALLLLLGRKNED